MGATRELVCVDPSRGAVGTQAVWAAEHPACWSVLCRGGADGFSVLALAKPTLEQANADPAESVNPTAAASVIRCLIIASLIVVFT
ncbi:hypothetical protein CU100_14500 [Phyllobacterium endophyticum]|uniref:Uncharacterized protein n=1 Tax=Phyllobacterium endophyticum TaxID=1149773 RepID=A0A2P7AQT9_9HYPH|nr:hypothetical protein CU100_14500 [Phyllobacterium endophyticum]